MMGHSKLSTSALAKLLELSTQQLFTTLKDFGWIRKLDEGWALTNKGEFEGGEYVHSKRFGRYIVWPEDLAEHPLLQALEDNRHISPTALGKGFGLNAREVNRLLAELAWIKHDLQGWELTAEGERQGGIQLENESTGTYYIVWPLAVKDHSVLTRELNRAAAVLADDGGPGDDLFSNQQDYSAVDGHSFSSRAALKICHWLYMAGIAHACNRQLPCEEDLRADFYLPAFQLYIEYWGEDDSRSLSLRMKRREFYDQQGLAVVEIQHDDLAELDHVLGKQLRKHGVRVY